MNVVLDTNVLLSSTLWDGSEAQKLLFKLIRSDIKVFTSPDILSEYERVLKRDFDYSDGEILNILEKVLAFAALVKPSEKIAVVKEDPDDDKIIECAVAANAEYIITYDKHLLNLGRFRGIKVVKPNEVLRMI